MGRRLYKLGRDTHAKGETFGYTDGETEHNQRYQVLVSLLSLKTLRDYDIGRGGEFYFKVKRRHKWVRVPIIGTINLMENQVFTARQDFSLWIEMIELDEKDSKDIELEIELFERDVAKLDKKVFERKLPIHLGTQTKYQILEDDKNLTKAKLKISAMRTRY
ncbi:MAG: hypothetical protein ACTSQI_04915 [Candidatus Helarchaeota archaeon]